jgi:hypothetical protein
MAVARRHRKAIDSVYAAFDRNYEITNLGRISWLVTIDLIDEAMPYRERARRTIDNLDTVGTISPKRFHHCANKLSRIRIQRPVNETGNDRHKKPMFSQSENAPRLVENRNISGNVAGRITDNNVRNVIAVHVWRYVHAILTNRSPPWWGWNHDVSSRGEVGI